MSIWCCLKLQSDFCAMKQLGFGTSPQRPSADHGRLRKQSPCFGAGEVQGRWRTADLSLFQCLESVATSQQTSKRKEDEQPETGSKIQPLVAASDVPGLETSAWHAAMAAKMRRSMEGTEDAESIAAKLDVLAEPHSFQWSQTEKSSGKAGDQASSKAPC